MFPAGNREDEAGEIGEASHLRVGEHAEEQVIAGTRPAVFSSALAGFCLMLYEAVPC